MKDDIKINIYANPTKSNPESYRMKVQYKDKNNVGKIETTYPRWQNEKEAKRQQTLWAVDYAKNTGFFALPEPEHKPEIPKVLTFRMYAKSYSDKKITDVKSERTFKYEMNVLLDYFADTPLCEIDFELISQFEIDMRKPYKVIRKIRTDRKVLNPKTNRKKAVIDKVKIEKIRSDSTVNHLIKRLRNMLYTAKREKKIDEQPDFHLIVKPENPSETITISFAELEKLLSVCTNKHLYLQVLCIYETGGRISEVKAIKKRDLNIKTQICKVEISKQKKYAKYRKPRNVYFSKRLIAAILADDFDKKSDDDFIFIGDTNDDFNKAKILAFTDTENPTRRAELLEMQMQKSLRKSARTNYLNARILEYVADYQLSHAPNSISRKHYQEISEELMFEEFQRYEDYSTRERAKLQKAMTA